MVQAVHVIGFPFSSFFFTAFLWRRATRQLSKELRCALSPRALRDVLQAIVEGQRSGLQTPPPAFLVDLFKEVSRKLIYWSLYVS